MKSNFSRREALKRIGLGSAAVTVGGIGMVNASSKDLVDTQYIEDKKVQPINFEQPITAIVLGAGGRGNLYAGYALDNPKELNIIGVAEPIKYRRDNFSKSHNISESNQFITWEHVFERPKFADAVIITTPDALHYGPAMKAIEMGYDVLLEKAIAQTWDECYDILKQQRKYGKIVAICHVLRYAPYFVKMKEIIDSGKIGEVVSVQHFEPVEHIHMSHSFVRGNWGNSKKSTPMILSKSCHDTDIIRWLVGKPCKKVSSFGSLKLFRSQSAPQGSTKRCTDGCAVERECPFSAIKIYAERKIFLHHLKLEKHDTDSIMENLKTGPYGRCVYHCDNDVVDHQVVNMQFEDDITASFSMEGLTSYGGRRTRIMGTMGDIVGDMDSMTVFDFRTREQKHWTAKDINDGIYAGHGHGGGDMRLARDFVRAVKLQDPTQLTSTIEASMESHLIGFQAEKSRLKGGKVFDVNLNV
ncbi:Gfo/Idh/MocA family protein [Aestuariivivens sp. NBU2969]|uniref:Gfo/Idh/MocA family protein n=1 Tax=Aestuariivivens sp. NBU2969 TaxID=2873267 RepID=UPI001CBC956E|nr:Gfo/Idh/MocA family oxidoreductase [Aestuariivivens sp. NBU2969]